MGLLKFNSNTTNIFSNRYNPSCIWHGIYCSQVVLRKGLRWKIGDGLSMNVWNDSWLWDYDNMKVVTSLFEGLEDAKVIDLMIPNCRQWDMKLLHDIFYEGHKRNFQYTTYFTHRRRYTCLALF